MKWSWIILVFIAGASACTGNVGQDVPDSRVILDLRGLADTTAMVVPTGDSGSCISNCEGYSCGEEDNCGRHCNSGFCAKGTICVEGECLCDETTCPDGCCRDDECFPGMADDHCGTGGQECLVCSMRRKGLWRI